MKYKKWGLLGLVIWFCLYIIFWATMNYTYTGFLSSIIIFALMAFVLVRLRRKDKKSDSR